MVHVLRHKTRPLQTPHCDREPVNSEYHNDKISRRKKQKKIKRKVQRVNS